MKEGGIIRKWYSRWGGVRLEGGLFYSRRMEVLPRD